MQKNPRHSVVIVEQPKGKQAVFDSYAEPQQSRRGAGTYRLAIMYTGLTAHWLQLAHGYIFNNGSLRRKQQQLVGSPFAQQPFSRGHLWA